MTDITIVWLRQDLRLTDNPALHAAMQRGIVVPVFIWAPDEEGSWGSGAASNWWLHQSLASLDRALREAGSRLVIRRGPTLEALRTLAREAGATAVMWNRRYEPAIVQRDAAIKEALHGDGLDAESFNAALLREPWTVRNQAGRPFQVFTPFWKHLLRDLQPLPPIPGPARIEGPSSELASLDLAELALQPRIDWASGMRMAWTPGEAGAAANLARFLDDAFDEYPRRRDLPAEAGTSRLSPHLHFGEIGPRQVWDAVMGMAAARGWDAETWRSSRFLTELGWREFSHHLLYHFPRTPDEPLRPEFARFPWQPDAAKLAAWRAGRTGFPIVDAGMRELWATGWMHNRVRMIVASFLVKDLLIPWQEGARWFWDTLVDADLAQNTLGWQWSAGCGADAAPFFRIFNPASQGRKFDPEGTYVRRWCPELARLPAKWIHEPHAAPSAVQLEAGIAPGSSWASPVVSHAVARDRALAAFARIRGSPDG